MGRKIVLTGVTLTDPNAPKLLKVDPIESVGSMLLIDPAHPAGAWGSGVPGHGALVPNLFRDQAATIIDSNPEDADLRMATGENISAERSILERSSRGGLHIIATQGGSGVAYGDALLGMSRALVRYFLANPTNDVYASLWVRITRRPLLSNGVLFGMVGQQQTNSYLFAFYPNSIEANEWGIRPTWDGEPHRYFPAGSGLVAKYGSVGAPGWLGENGLPDTGKGAPAGPVAGGGIVLGAGPRAEGIGASGNTASFSISPSSTSPNQAASYVLYRCYMEDLTVSGRTYAEVDAIDQELFTLAVLTPGGRYYGDTFTDPATIP